MDDNWVNKKFLGNPQNTKCIQWFLLFRVLHNLKLEPPILIFMYRLFLINPFAEDIQKRAPYWLTGIFECLILCVLFTAIIIEIWDICLPHQPPLFILLFHFVDDVLNDASSSPTCTASFYADCVNSDNIISMPACFLAQVPFPFSSPIFGSMKFVALNL